MDRETHELIERFHDGELKARDRARVEALLASSGEARGELERLGRLSGMLRLLNEEALSDVSFEGFDRRVALGVERDERRPGPMERIATWTSEFLEHRRAVWIPATAVAVAAAAALVALPFVSGAPPVGPGTMEGAAPAMAAAEPQPAPAPRAPEKSEGIRTTSAPIVAGGSEIAAVSFGGSTGMVFEVRDGLGQATGIVWVNE